MSVGTYCPSVRVGNWNEDVHLEEDILKDFLHKREKGELITQKSHDLGAVLLKKREISTSRDGFVHFGDHVTFFCRESVDRKVYSIGMGPRHDAVLAISLSDPDQLEGGDIENSCSVSGCMKTESVLRTVFVIKSVDGAPDGECLRYGQDFHICPLEEIGNLYLHSDRAMFQRCAKKSRHQEVLLVTDVTYATNWHIKCRDPRLRLEFEFVPVPANEEVIISNSKTNENLALEQNSLLRTIMGAEYEISCHNYLDSHKADKDVNRWLIKMNVPGEAGYEIPTDARVPPADILPPPPQAVFETK